MTSRRTRRFHECFARLPSDIRNQARQAYRLFRDDPGHPGLRFKRVHQTEPIYSVRVSRGYRAVGVLRDDAIIWFWIGSSVGIPVGGFLRPEFLSNVGGVCQPKPADEQEVLLHEDFRDEWLAIRDEFRNWVITAA